MPTYEYQCSACEHYFEQYQSIKDSALRKCPSCGKLKLERLISAGAGVIFKGSGFYETDYRSDSYKQEAKKDTETSSSSASSSKPDKSDSSSSKKDSGSKKTGDKKK